MLLLTDLRRRFAAALAGLTDKANDYAQMVRPTQDPKFGDYQANFAMPLGKELGRAPRDVAVDVVARLDLGDLYAPPEIAGPGFINLKLRDDRLAALVSQQATLPHLGVEPAVPPRTYVVDYSSPNVAKPMHVGHLRSTVIGDALCRILRFLGHQVIADNHVGDWGAQFGMIIFGYKNFLNADAAKENLVQELARLYRLVNRLIDYHEARGELPNVQAQLAQADAQLAALAAAPSPDKDREKEAAKRRKKLVKDQEETADELKSLRKKIDAVETNPQLAALAAQHPDIVDRARAETAKLHAGDAENVGLWQEFIPQCLAALDGLYERLDVKFDVVLGESAYNPELADVVRELTDRGLARESDGAMCVFNEGFAAPFLIRKRDGAFTYATTDLATIRHRVRKFHADVLWYVVDVRQGDHFKQLFETARRWGFDNVEYLHVSFGTVLGDDGKPFKTRDGDTVGLESLLDEANAAAARVLAETPEEGRPVLDSVAQRQVAEVVGIGGVKYADLKHNRESDYVFSWDKMLSKTGDTATYLQYAYARVCGIFRKGDLQRDQIRASAAPIRLTLPQERALALQLLRFGDALQSAVHEARPNFVTEYLYQTASVFTAFFENCPVLKAESEELRASRLRLADLTARVLAQGLDLLGIRTLEQM